MIGLKERESQLNAMPLYKRIIFLVILIIFIYMLWDLILWKNILHKKENSTRQIQTIETSIRTLKTQLNIAIANYKKVKKQSQQKRTLKTQKSKLQKEIMTHHSTFIKPNETSKILKKLLTEKHELKLISLSISPSQKIGGLKQKFEVFESGIEMKFQGEYFPILNYLKEIETLHWPLLWDKLEYKVLNYPKAEVTLKIQTLSKEQGGINV